MLAFLNKYQNKFNIFNVHIQHYVCIVLPKGAIKNVTDAPK